MPREPTTYEPTTTQRPLTILNLVQQPQRRGAEMFAFDLTAELRRAGHVASTAYLYPSSPATAFPVRSFAVVVGADPQHLSERVPGINPSLLRGLGRIVDEHQPDIVQANGARTLKYGAALHRFGRSRSFGLVYRSIGDPAVWVTGRVKRAVYPRLIMPEVDGVVAVSANTLRGLSELYDLSGKAVAQIPRGIAPARVAPREPRREVRRRLGASDDDPVVVFVGSLTDEKRPDRLVRVFADVAGSVPTARLWVIGEGPQRDAMERGLEAMGLSDRSRCLGATDDVGSYMAAADVLLLTSDTEGLPGVILEAAALGVPTVATDVGGVGDAVVHEVTGLLADAADESGLARSLERLLRDPTTSGELGRTARRRFEEEFDIAVVAERYVQLYRDVLQSHAGR